ncbi:heme ABC transporter ATP-binding protein [Fischerella thermalis CCMEE 5273]|nr:heme ABC transporter ATP-binding protein [Fischerella thermalis CCMEE 5273]
MTAIVSFCDFSFRYKQQSAPTLKQINLEIQPGELILIAGPSGSGKSTLAHCINGLIPFSYEGEVTGQMRIRGVPPRPRHLSDISRTVGTILQDQDGQFVGLTVGEDVAFALENECLPPEEMKREVIRALKQVDMLPFIDQSPHACSGGQKQRVSLAGILSLPCEVLLFDEPLANLDPASGQQAMALIQAIRKTGKTIILIEHRIEDVLRHPVDRMVIMDHGQIQAIGTPDALLASGVLPQFGLREPLVIEALRYAGYPWRAADGVSAPHPSQRPSYVKALQRWVHPPTAPPPTESRAKAPVLALKNIRFSYAPGPEVISDISCTIHEGEVVSLLGNNGAGKSTLAHLITGMITPDAGEIRLDGESIRDWSIRKRGHAIGYVMQNPNQMITQAMVTDEVALGLRMKGADAGEVEEKVHAVLRTCGLYPYRNWPVSALSYGQKKRLTVASMLVMEPRIIILDEPTAGQDFRHYTEFMQFIRSLASQGIAFLFITHDLYLAMEYSDRSIVLSQGKIIADAPTTTVLTNPAIIQQASLLELSLSQLARQSDLDPADFLSFFVRQVRRQRDGVRKEEVHP